MTLTDAREALSRDPTPGVAFTPPHGGTPEYGVITSVNSRWIFVCYGGGTTSAATEPGCLTLLTPEVAERARFRSSLRGGGESG